MEVDSTQKAFNTTAKNGTGRATDKGTTIVKPGNDMDKNSFLKILVAELSNQDPQNAKDSTAYVAQMAQFAGLEQMSNLNSNLNFSNATSLIGKIVAFSSADSLGNQYGGVVKGVYKNSSGVQLNVEIIENDKKIVKDFPYDTVTDVIEGLPTPTPTPIPTSTTTTTNP